MIARKLGLLARIAAGSILLTSAGCRDAVPATLVASARTEGMVVTDRTPLAAGFVAMSEAVVPVIEWVPTTTPSIQAGETVTIPRSAIVGFAENGGPVVVYWWGLRPAAGGGYERVPGVGGTLHVTGL